MNGFSKYQNQVLTHFRCLRCGQHMLPGLTALRCYNCGNEYPVLHGSIIDVTGKPQRNLSLAQKAGQWRPVAWLYDRVWRGRAFGILTGRNHPPRRELQKVLEAIDIDSSAVVLDNACANGYYGRSIAAKMKRKRSSGVVVANDISLPMLVTALHLARRAGVDHRMLFVRSDSENMPFLDKSFDAVMCGGSLNEFRRPDRVVSELHRVMKPSAHGSLMLQIAAQAPRLQRFQRILESTSGLAFPTADEVLAMLSRRFRVAVTLQEGALLMVRLVN